MLPAGIITLWYGAIGIIPAGWVLCDGNNGTPDLRNRFVVGAGDTYAVDANGGAVNHAHPFNGDGHDHTMPGGTDIKAGANYNQTTNQNFVAGTTDNGSSLPPYHSLAYIMKT